MYYRSPEQIKKGIYSEKSEVFGIG